MSVLGAILLVLAGLAIMAFGIFLFYAWLPLFYGLFGLEIGLLLGQWLTGDIGLVAIILGIVGAVILFGAAYILEPYRRILLGISAGSSCRGTSTHWSLCHEFQADALEENGQASF